MSNSIRTIADQQKEKKKLLIRQEASRQLFNESLHQTKLSTFQFLTTKLLLPAGIAGIAGMVGWGTSNLFSSNGHSEMEEKESGDGPSLLKQLLPIAAQVFFG